MLQVERVPAVRDWLRARVRILTATLAETYREWRSDRCIRLGAGLAYYGLFALVPLLTLTIALAGVVFNIDEVQDFLAEPLARLLGADIDDVAATLADQINGRLVTQLGLIGVGSLLVAASLVFAALQDALNVIWGVPYQAGLEQAVRRRLISFSVVLLTGGALIASLAAQAVVSLLGGLLPADAVAIAATTLANGLLPVAIAAVALALIFRLLPHAAVEPRAAVVSGVVTAVVMAAGLLVVGWYLSRFGASSVQGAAGSVFVVLTAIYAQSQIMLAGAELSKVLTRRWTSPTPGIIQPT
jgi:membrane protein